MKCKYLLLGVFVLICLNSCKKNAAPAPAVTIVGKWFVTKQASQLINNGVEIKSFNNSSFTTADFVIYYSDGTGYNSKSSSAGPSLTEFTYTIKGTAITEFTSVENKGIPETVTSLTANNMSIHAESLVSDPNDPSVTDTEIDDYNYKK